MVGTLLLTAVLTPQAEASGGPGGANDAGCTPTVGGHVGATTPVPITENTSIDCPLPSGPPGVRTGPSGPLPGPFTPGQDCMYVTYQPVKLAVTGDGGVIEYDPSATGAYGGGLSYPNDLKLVPLTTSLQYDIYIPYRFDGKADPGGHCTIPNPGFHLGCPDPEPFTNFVVVGNICWHTVPNAVVGTGIPPGPLRAFIDQAALLQFIQVGSISSLPDNPNAGLVNIGTCFFVTGARFQAAGTTPQPISQPATYQMSVSQPVNDGSGRFIFYVFRIRLAFTGAEWDFGDGPQVLDAALPPACQGVPADLAVSHTYRRYGNFQVTVTEHFDVTVDEFWEDANQENHLTLTGLIPPITRTLALYPKQVIQEEGVPVGV